MPNNEMQPVVDGGNCGALDVAFFALLLPGPGHWVGMDRWRKKKSLDRSGKQSKLVGIVIGSDSIRFDSIGERSLLLDYLVLLQEESPVFWVLGRCYIPHAMMTVLPAKSIPELQHSPCQLKRHVHRCMLFEVELNV